MNEPMLWIGAALAFFAAALVLFVVLRGRGERSGRAALESQLADLSQKLVMLQADLGGRLQQAQSGVNERLDGLGKRLGDGLAEQTEKTGETLKELQTRLAVIDRAQQNIANLSQQVVGLQDILSNKQARGALGEIQLQDIVTSILPRSAYELQVTLSRGTRVDCLLKLPNPPGPIAIDAKFPLESYVALREASEERAMVEARRAFRADVVKHLKDIAERYILPGETAESALMFLPSEAVYAEIHSNFRDVIEESYRRRVWIVSPTTLMATLNTVRAVLKDARMREQAGVIQAEVRKLLEDIGRLDDRVGRLNRHFDQTVDDIRQIRISTDKVTRWAERIEEIELGEDSPAEELEPPARQLSSE